MICFGRTSRIEKEAAAFAILVKAKKIIAMHYRNEEEREKFLNYLSD